MDDCGLLRMHFDVRYWYGGCLLVIACNLHLEIVSQQCCDSFLRGTCLPARMRARLCPARIVAEQLHRVRIAEFVPVKVDAQMYYVY